MHQISSIERCDVEENKREKLNIQKLQNNHFDQIHERNN